MFRNYFGLFLTVVIFCSVAYAGEPNVKPAPHVNFFHGKVCSKDCSGHIAGYKWAQKKNIRSVNDCRGSSKSFVEGCRIYVEEHYAPKLSQ